MTKPTAEQTAWVFSKINEIIESNKIHSFRSLIYKIMEYTEEDYSALYCAGGQHITNLIGDWKLLKQKESK